MNKKNILLAAAVFVVGQTYGAQPMNDLSTVAAVRACVTGQRVQAEQNAVQELVSAEISRRNNLGTFSRIAEDVFINPITACGSMLYGGIKNVGFYSYHFLKYPLVSVGLVTAGRSAGSVLQKEISDDTYKKLLFGGAAAGAIWAVYQAPKDIVKIKQIKDLKNENKNLKTELYISTKLTVDYADTYGSLQQIIEQTAALGKKQEQTTIAVERGNQQLLNVNKAIERAGQEFEKTQGELNQIRAEGQRALVELEALKGQGADHLSLTAFNSFQHVLTNAGSLTNTYGNILAVVNNPVHQYQLIELFAINLNIFNELNRQLSKTLSGLSVSNSVVYIALKDRGIENISEGLSNLMIKLNQYGATFGLPVPDQAPIVQQALEDRVEEQNVQQSLMAASNLSTTSSSSSNTNTLPLMPVDSLSSSSVTTWSLSEAEANTVPRALPITGSFLSIMNNTSRPSTPPALT